MEARNHLTTNLSVSAQFIEDGHANRHAVFNLPQNEGVFAVRNDVGYFHATIDWPGM